MDFDVIEQAVEKECEGMAGDTGVVVALGKLKELMKGYRFALDLGYAAKGETYEERESQP